MSAEPSPRPALAKLLLTMVVRMGLFPVVFLWPAGTWRWWEAWAVIGIYLAWAIGLVVFLLRHDPALLSERMKGSPVQAGQKGWDKVIMVGMVVVGIPLLLLPGFDVVRFGWSSRLPVWLELAAMVLHVPCLVGVSWVMKENTYLARVVKVDEARGHSVITTGPYAIVRHPMYACVLPLLLAMPVALGSRWTLIPAVLMGAMLVWRTALEDRTLHAELAGYPEYAAKTRFRLIPGVW